MCPKCGTKIEIDHNFCGACRMELRQLMTHCSNCGQGYHLWGKGAPKFNGCPACGNDSFIPPSQVPA